MTELMQIHEIRLMNARALMKESGLSRTDLAEKIGMSYNLLSQYVGKNPTKNIGDETAVKIENAFGKPRGYLDQNNLASNRLLNNERAKELKGKWIPVKAYSKMGNDGYFTDMGYDGDGGDGYVPSLTAGPHAYAVKGDGKSMYPAIRHGWYAVCDPDAAPTPTEFVEVRLKGDRRTIKEFIGVVNNVLHLLAVNGEERITIDMDEVEAIVAVIDIVPPSRHVEDIPMVSVKKI